MTPTPHECFMSAIARWEGEWQADPNDSGNWVNCPGGRKLIGTMRGVTPAALGLYMGVNPCSLSAADMQSWTTLEVAARIGVQNFYDRPGFDDLEWSPLIDIAMDIGWGSGPAKGVKMLQALIGATVDGDIGPQTQKLYARAIHARPIGDLCDTLSKARRDFYISISPPGDKDHKFQKGWLRRADWYTTGNAEWWDRWKDWQPSGASETGKPVAPPAAPREHWLIRLIRALFGRR